MAMLAAMATGGRRRTVATQATSGTITFTNPVDTVLHQNTPTTDFSTNPTLKVDADDPATSGLVAQTLVRFDNLFGTGAGQIPPGSAISSAQLELTTTNSTAAGNGAALHRMLQSWSATDTWTSKTAGISANGTEAVATADVTIDSAAVGTATYNVTASVQAWSDGAANHGWVFLPRGSDGWEFYSAEGTTPPRLTVTYAPNTATVPIFAFNWATAQTGATVARSTTGTRINASGVRESIAANAARYDYSPITGNAFQGVLVEPAATNLVLHSADPANAAWSKANLSIATGGGTGMDGTNSLKTLTSTWVSGGAPGMSQNITFAAGASVTATCWLKRGTIDWVYMVLFAPGFASAGYGWFNLNTVTGGSSEPGTNVAIASKSIRALSNGLLELKITYTTSTNTSGNFQLVTDVNNASWGNVPSGGTLLFDSIQVETGATGATGSSYYGTTTATATRAAETLTVAATNGTYDILVVDPAGGEWRDDVVVTGGTYAVTPRSGQRHVQRVQAHTAGLTNAQKENIYAGGTTVTPEPEPEPTPSGTYVTMWHTVKTSGDTAGFGSRIFYLSNSGNNNNAGTSPGAAWADWSKVASSAGSFQAGDRILFQRGGTWSTNAFNGMQINFSGSAAAPIVIGAYGSGNPPVLNTTGAWGTAMEITATSQYIQIRDLKISSNVTGVLLECGIRAIGRYVTIANCEITNVGQGILVPPNAANSADIVIENCYIHDIVMLVNTDNGPPPGSDDDYGCIGIHVKTSNVTIRKNTFKNMIAQSYDYYVDGSIIEILPREAGQTGTVNNVLVQNNYCENTVGFTELGGNPEDTVSNIVFDHNIIVDVMGVIYFHNGGSSTGGIGTLTNVRFTNNTVYSRMNDTYPAASSVYGFRGSDGSFFTSRNNVFDVGRFDHYDFGASNYTRSNNLYFLGTTNQVRSDLTTAANEYSGNPAFLNATSRDFRLTASSAALNRATALTGYLTDYNGNDLTGRPNLDVGALEYIP